MLDDPGVGWHLKTGEYILATHTIPQNDLFSFTMPGAPWTTYEWLFQVLAAWLAGIGGLPLLTATSTLVYAALPVLLYRKMVRENSNVALAALLAILSYVLLSAHSHARPHILTYVFFLILADRLARYDRGAIPGRSLIWFVPLTVVWTNVHGGFVVGPVLVGLYFVGTALKYAASRAGTEMTRLRAYAALAAGMGVASLVNPAGWNLHLKILEYLSSDSLALMAEYRSPDFRSGGAAMFLFELLILGLVLAIGVRRTSLDLTECLILVFFLHHSLSAVRHVFLFALVAVPILAREITPALEAAPARFRQVFEDIAARQKSLRSDAVYFPLISVVFLTLSLTAHSLFRTDLDGIYLSQGAARFIEMRQDQFTRVFNTSALGGALVYRFWPDTRVFGDDRNDFYGDDFVINKYFRVLSGREDWQRILDEYDVSSAIVLRGEVAGGLFRTSPDWDLVYHDDKNEIFTRAD